MLTLLLILLFIALLPLAIMGMVLAAAVAILYLVALGGFYVLSLILTGGK